MKMERIGNFKVLHYTGKRGDHREVMGTNEAALIKRAAETGARLIPIDITALPIGEKINRDD